MNLQQARQEGLNRLNKKHEVDILLAHVLNVSKVFLYTNPAYILSQKEEEGFYDSLFRRLHGEPLQHILSYAYFMDLKLIVNKDVLIPRPETEVLVEKALSLITDKGAKLNILDLCSGSGAIAIALGKRLKNSSIYATDISQKALDIARANAKANRVDNITFILSDLFEGLEGISFDYIISNPPYIKSGDIKDLDIEVKDYEPLLALDGGLDGLDFYRRIINDSRAYLKGQILFEVAYDQANDLVDLFKEKSFSNITIEKDFNGIERIVYASYS